MMTAETSKRRNVETSKRKGLTLLEVVLAMGLFVVLSSMTYWFYSSALTSCHVDTQTAQKMQLMRITLRQMAQEIRQASALTAEGQVGLRGNAERIWLSTSRVPTRSVTEYYSSLGGEPPAEYDMAKIEYKIARHPDILHEDGYPEALGLAKVEHRIPRPDSAESGAAFEEMEALGGHMDERRPAALSEEDQRLFDEQEGNVGVGIEDEIEWEHLYSKDIHFLRFCYYDGSRWWDDWDIGGPNPLPQLVQVTLGFEGHPPFDAELGVQEKEAEEFCTCLNREPPDCPPLPEDQYSMTVRIPQADPFFRSRVGREMKSMIDQLGAGGEAEGEDSGATGTGGRPAGSKGGSPAVGSGSGKPAKGSKR